MKEIKIAIVGDVHLVERNHSCRKDNFLETAMGKLEWIAQNNDYVIVLGDLFHNAANSTYLLWCIYTLFMKYKGKFIGIYGNHDIFNRNMSCNNKTTAGFLKLTGAYNLMFREEFELGGLKFYATDVEEDIKSIPVDNTHGKILLAHKYYNQPDKGYESFTPDDIRELGYNTVFLGHDHKPYSEAFVGNSIIIRMGSLTRIDTQEYNKDREILYYQLITTGDGEFEYSAKIVPSRPIKECFTEEAYSHTLRHSDTPESISYIKIGDALAKLTKKVEGTNSLDEVLKRIGAPKDHRDEIRWRHQLNNVRYT